MSYIKNTENGKIPEIQDGLKQTFQYQSTASVSRHVIAKMKEEDTLKDRDLEISKFLFRFRFATLEQIYQYLKITGFITRSETADGEVRETSINSIKARLDKLVSYKVLNKFQLGLIQYKKIEQDSFQIYCLDWGGKYLLANYSNEDTSNWYSSENLKASCHISKDLAVTNIYLKILENCGDRLVAFEKTPVRRCENTNIVPTFDFTIEYMGTFKHFICEDIKSFDLPVDFRKKALKLEKLLTTNAWRKYYFETENPPILLLFGESDNEALDSARIIAGQTEIKNFRVNTEERVLEDLSIFFKYIEEKDTLQRVKVNVFSKE